MSVVEYTPRVKLSAPAAEAVTPAQPTSITAVMAPAAARRKVELPRFILLPLFFCKFGVKTPSAPIIMSFPRIRKGGEKFLPGIDGLPPELV